MKEFIYISLIAIIYSLIRAKHDSYINASQWKKWAVIEAIFISAVVTYLTGDGLIDYIFLPMLFGICFSISFDVFCGWFRAKKLFYFGSDTYDQKMKAIFWTPLNFFVFKLIWVILISGAYLELMR